METTESMNKPKKASLVKNAAWTAFLDIFLVLLNLFLMFRPKFTFIEESFFSNSLLNMLVYCFLMILCIIVLIVAMVQTRNTEKQDELSRLHRYKAGYIAKYICIIAVITAIWCVQDFRFAFSGDIIQDLSLPIIIYSFTQFFENIIFIILEKCNLE